MKKTLLLLLATSLTATAQVTVFEDSFETYPEFTIDGFGEWDVLDLDGLETYVGGRDETNWQATWPNAGSPQAFMVFNPATATGELEDGTPTVGLTNNSTGTPENRNFDPRTGSKYAAAWASVPSTSGGATANNDWLISPVIHLGTSNNELTFYAKSLSDSYGLERYRVGVYVGTGMPTSTADFTVISTGIGALSAPYPNWGLNTFSLNAYSNQQIRIGIRCVTPDAYMFMVDDFKVTSSNLSANEFLASKFATYPNPATSTVTLTNNQGINVSGIQITDLNGRVVKTFTYNEGLETLQLDVSELSSGMYIMNVRSDQGQTTKKFIKN